MTPAPRVKKPPSARRRALGALLLGVVVGLGLILLAYRAARKDAARARAERVAVVDLGALVDVVERAGGTGDAVRHVVEKWGASHPSLRAIRVIAFEGVSLEASTAPDDQGERAAPRRLRHEEKGLYDQGQRLRASVETNAQEGVSRKEEIEVRASPGGGYAVAAPMERDGAVIGMVAIEAAPQAAPAAVPWPAALLLLLAPLVLYALLAPLAGGRRSAAPALAAVLLVATLVAAGTAAVRDLVGARRGAQEAVAHAVAGETAAARALLAGIPGGEATPLHPERWDADVYRHPRGLIAAGGGLDARAVSSDLGRLSGEGARGFGAVGLLAAALFAFVALGAASHLRATIARHRQAYAYTFPAMIGMLVLVFFPFLYGIALSFTDSTIYNTNKAIPDIWIGLRNYLDILGDFSVLKHTAAGTIVNYLNFYWTFFFTVVWTVTNVALGVTSGLVLALILNTKGLKLRPLYRVLLILPWATPNYITALIWKGMFHQQFGVINQAIQLVGGRPVSWFETPFTSYLTALATNGWLSFPFMMVVSLGALQSISSELYEAARIDGATRWQQFRSITLPSLRPALVPAIILSVIWTFNMFNIIYLVTQGEPGGSTEILITQSYKFAFEKYRYGYAAAYSTVIFVILFVYGTIQNRVTRATEAIAG